MHPEVGLKDALERRDAARKQLADGISSSLNRTAQKSLRQPHVADSFETVSRSWYEKHAPNWVASHGDRIIHRLKRDIFPHISNRPIGEIASLERLDVVLRIEARGAFETAHRALNNRG